MMTPTEKNAIHISTALGMTTLLLGIVMLFTFPLTAELSEGFRTPIIAFEFAKTADDVAFLTGDSEMSLLNRQKMDAGHQWDMLFPFAYGGFLAFLLLQMTQRKKPIAWVGIIFAIAIVPFDIHENFVLLDITAFLNDASVSDDTARLSRLLAELDIATWLKWGAMGAAILMLSVSYSLSHDYRLALISGITALTIAACWLLNAQAVIAEAMSLTVFLYFIIMTGVSTAASWRIIKHGA